MHFTRKASITSLLSTTLAAPAPAPATATTQAASTPSVWQPRPGLTWNYQLSPVPGPDVTGYQAIDLDLFDTPATTISTLKSKGTKVICYFSAGSYEAWRPDASKFKTADLGKALDGWPGENWLQTKSTNVQNVMLARLDMAKQKGCDGVEPDNTDAYNNDNGLGLTKQDAANHVLFLADAAKARGLAIGLKNSGEIISTVINKVQFAINEQCVAYKECALWQSFISAGKAVFHVEYPKADGVNNNKNVSAAKEKASCSSTGMTGFSNIIKNHNLNAWIQKCPVPTAL